MFLFLNLLLQHPSFCDQLFDYYAIQTITQSHIQKSSNKSFLRTYLVLLQKLLLFRENIAVVNSLRIDRIVDENNAKLYVLVTVKTNLNTKNLSVLGENENLLSRHSMKAERSVFEKTYESH